MGTSVSRSSELKACALAVGAAATLIVTSAAAGDDVEVNIANTAKQSPRVGAQSAGVPYPGISVQAGKDEQKLTGAFAYTTDYGITFDVKLTGANVVKKTQQSLLFDALGSAPGGQLSFGVTWSNFHTRTSVAAQVDKLCAEQNKANGYGSDPDDDAILRAKLATDAAYKRATEAQTALEAELKAVGDHGEATTAAEKLWKAYEKARADVEATQQAADKLDPTKDAAQLRAALETARRQAAAANNLHIEAVRAEARAARAARLPTEIARAKEDVDKEKKRVEGSLKICFSRSQLTPERRSRLLPTQPTAVIALRGTFEAKSTDYLDTADGKKKKDMAYPMSISIIAGAYVHPTSLLAIHLDYGRTRTVADPTSVCQDLPVDGKTTAPPTYNCTSLTVGAPTWASKTSLRGEYRQYIAAGIGINPSFTYAWAGPETGLFAAKTGSWSLDFPIYMRLNAAGLGGAPAAKKEADPKAKDSGGSDPNALSFGVALTHRQTWGLGDKNETTDDVSVFLGGSFDLKP